MAASCPDVRGAEAVDQGIGIHLVTSLDGAYLFASPSEINGLGLLIACQRIGKRGGQVLVKGRLIAFDGQNRLGPSDMHEAEKFAMGVQGIGGTDPLLDG